LMVYDASRSKWLSVSEWVVGWGDDFADGSLLAGYGITTPGSGTGVKIPKNATIVAVAARAKAGNATKGFTLRKNTSTSIHTFSLSSSEYTNLTLDIDLASGDYIWLEADAAGLSAQDVVVIYWIKWRVTP